MGLIPEILFYLFAVSTLLFGVLVITSRNPVNSAVFLVLTMISLAGLFVLLHAFFLGIVQIIVYAGAVMVLFLFVIMLLDLKEEELFKIRRPGFVTGVVVVGAIVVLFMRFLRQVPGADASTLQQEGQTIPLGKLLFTHYLLPFEIVSILLLVAMVGAILLSKKDLK